MGRGESQHDLAPERDDPVLDAALYEVLGGGGPPDLTGRIMAELARRHGEAKVGPVGPTGPAARTDYPLATSAALADHNQPQVQSGGQDLLDPPLVEPPVCPPDTNGHTSNAHSNGHHSSAATLVTHVAPARKKEREPLSASWGLVTLAACLMIGSALLFSAYVIQLMQHGDGGNVAVKPDDADPQPTTQPADQPTLANADGEPSRDRRITGPDKSETLDSPIFNTGDLADRAGGLKWDGRYVAAPLADAEIIARIDNQLREGWADANVKPAPPATDAEWARRVYLQLLGRIPTVEELDSFAANDSLTKKDELVDKLLGEEYREEYAQHWAGVWTNTLVGRMGGRRPGDLVHRDGLQRYLYASLRDDKPLDQLTTELIAATGSNNPDAADFNGATNFVLSGLQDDAAQVAAKTSRIFLGRQVQCMQCHDHPTNEGWDQHDFWQIAAFFRQAKPVKRGQAVRLLNEDFAGESGDIDEADIFFDKRNGELAVAYPVFFDGTALPRSGRVVDVDRRAALAKLVTRSEEFPKALANRLWSRFFHHGFTKPVDDFGPHQQPSHPEILNTLGQQLAAHNFDQKKLLRWMALTDAYGRSSQVAEANRRDNPLAGTPPLFSRYYTRQLPAEAVYDSVLVALGAVENGDRQFENARLQWLGRFSQDMNTDSGEEISLFDGSFMQTLEMMNGPLMHHATSTHDGGFLHRVATSEMSRDERINHLFLSALARKPTQEERTAARRVLTAPGDTKEGRLEGLQDLWWALLNSNEFILDH